MQARHHLSLLISWFAALLLMPIPVGFAAPPEQAIRVQCAGGRHFLVRLGPQRARIILEDRQFELRLKRSTLGLHYRGPAATLIIDGRFVAFVPQDDPGWQDCHIADSAEDKR